MAEIEIKIYCECGKQLKNTGSTFNAGPGIIIETEPCLLCAARNDEKGRKVGYEAGLDKGLEKGRSEAKDV